MNIPAALTFDASDLPSLPAHLDAAPAPGAGLTTWCDERRDASREAFDAATL